MKELITKIDLADKLSLSIGTIDNHMKAGNLKYLKIGKAVRFNSEDVDKWLVEHYPKKIKKVSPTEAEICKYLNMATQKKMLLFILEKKIVTSIQIRDHIKKSPSVVSVNLNELFKAKIINRKYDIPSNKFSLKKPQLLKAVLNEYYPDLTEKYWLRSSVSA